MFTKQNLRVWFDPGQTWFDPQMGRPDFSIPLLSSLMLQSSDRHSLVVTRWLQSNPRPCPSFLIHTSQKRVDSATSETSTLHIPLSAETLFGIRLSSESLSGWKQMSLSFISQFEYISKCTDCHTCRSA